MRMRIGLAMVVVMLGAASAGAQDLPGVAVGLESPAPSASESARILRTPKQHWLKKTVRYATMGAVFQNPPVGTKLDSLRWEHQTVDITAAAVNAFQLCYDAITPCSTITPSAAQFTPTTAQGGPPAAGNTAYKMLLPALTVGNHTVTVKACNTDGCGVATAPFAFRFAVIPGTPTGVAVISGSGGD